MPTQGFVPRIIDFPRMRHPENHTARHRKSFYEWLEWRRPLLIFLTCEEEKDWRTRLKNPYFTENHPLQEFIAECFDGDFAYFVHQTIEADLNFILPCISFIFTPYSTAFGLDLQRFTWACREFPALGSYG